MLCVLVILGVGAVIAIGMILFQEFRIAKIQKQLKNIDRIIQKKFDEK